MMSIKLSLSSLRDKSIVGEVFFVKIGLRDVCQAVVVQLTYASRARWGFSNVADQGRIEAFFVNKLASIIRLSRNHHSNPISTSADNKC